jgi:MFS family permease
MKINNIALNLSRFKSIFSSLQSVNYRRYFIGQSISVIGTWMQNIALSWLVYRLTNSVMLLGITGFTSQIPTFILSPFTGVITDRFNKRKLMLLAQIMFMVQSLIMALLVLFNVVEVWHIISLSLLFGIISAFDAPARQSLVIELIDNPEHLSNAIALNSVIFNSARLIGPGIAGFVIAYTGEGICFLLNSASYISVILALLKIKTFKKNIKTDINLKEGFSEGIRYTFGNYPIRLLIILIGLVSLLGISFTVLMPALAKEILHGSSDTLGILMSATGVGALCGALILASRRKVKGIEKILPVSIVALSGGIISISFISTLFPLLIVLAITGMCMIVSVASVNTLLQTIADEDKRGRVMSFYAMALMGMTPIGNLFAGSAAKYIGVQHAILISGVITLFISLWFYTKNTKLTEYIKVIYENKGL